jgi:signal transduction histidine kinase
MLGVVAMIFWLSYSMSSDTLSPEIVAALRGVLYSLYFVLAVLICIAAWWMVLTQESQTLAETELEEQNRELDVQIVERNVALSASQELLEKLQRLQENMVQSEKMAALGGLVAGIAHEINTPVGIILTSSTHLEAETGKTAARYQQGELSGDDLESYFDTARQSAHLITLNSQRAADLIHSFKQVAVDQSSGERREFELKGYIEEVLLSLQPTLKKTPIDIALQCPEGLMLDNYPGALSQILTNFIMNSLLHAYQPGQAGKLSIDVRAAPDDEIEIVYSDDGQGIPPESQSKIFEPFYTTRRGKGGSGLGLHIVYNIVRKTLQGSLHTHSVVGQGTTFTLTFPRVSANSAV